MAIVTISSELGADGSETGAALAKQLEYRYLDRVRVPTHPDRSFRPIVIAPSGRS